ncbi:MAG: fumarylacetoacetase [Cyclobacteriaceae bacterium]
MNADLKPNDPKLKSWVEVPSGSDFPIQNLPFGIFKSRQSIPGAGVAIGEFVVNLGFLHERGYFDGLEVPSGIFHQRDLNDFLALGREKIRIVRNRISELLQHDNETLSLIPALREKVLIPRSDVQMLLPVRVSNYTDFYSSEEHAFNVGSMFRDPENALLPNWKHLPVAYHGRASSIVVSGTDIHRPQGQIKSPDKTLPEFSPTRKLDFELELAFVTCGENKLGKSISGDKAEDYIAGFLLFNDWSARDIQQWEYVPLGPFLGKNFASTISPWIVTLDALEPFRVEGPPQDPPVLPYLEHSGKKNFDIFLEVLLQTDKSESAVLCRSNSKYLYWNINQQLAHHTVNGCNIQVGDVYASGTISGPSPGSFGSMLELSWNGEKSLSIPGGITRTFLEDGDTVLMRGYAEKDGVRIGFGECKGKILPS